jgi:hypothetical protein
MQIQDKSKFTNLMVGMGELYEQKILDSQVNFYWDALTDFELEDVRRAFKLHFNNSSDRQYFPKLPDILRFIAEDTSTRAEQAWNIVESVFRKSAHYEGLILTDPITLLALKEMGGWVELRASVLEEIHVYATEFKKNYCEFLEIFKIVAKSSE